MTKAKFRQSLNIGNTSASQTQERFHRPFRNKVAKAFRWLAVKRTLGWPAICLADLFSPCWFDRYRTPDTVWDDQILLQLTRHSEQLKRLWLPTLIQGLRCEFIPDDDDKSFFSWLVEFRTDATQSLHLVQALGVIAAQVYKKLPSDSVPLNTLLQSSYVAAVIMSQVNPNGWTQLADQILLDLAPNFHAHLLPVSSKSESHTLAEKLDYMAAKLIPLEFSVVVQLSCLRPYCPKRNFNSKDEVYHGTYLKGVNAGTEVLSPAFHV